MVSSVLKPNYVSLLYLLQWICEFTFIRSLDYKFHEVRATTMTTKTWNKLIKGKKSLNAYLVGTLNCLQVELFL